MADVDAHGPMFDGRAAAAAKALVKNLGNEIADEGVNVVRTTLDKVLKHPTGHYRSQIQTKDVADTDLVTDGNVVYGPWLEGVGSRNKTTRFKGYASFRRASQELQRKVPAIAERVTGKYIGRMN